LAGRRPGWIVWEEGIEDYALHPVHTETVRLIFRLYIAGYSTKQIAYKLNADERPVLGDKLRAGRLYTDWRATNVGRILRDESVLGLVQPHHMINGERQPIGSKSKVYRAAIEAADWLAVQEMLDSRRTLRGRKGKLVANIFTGHVFCGVCGGAMRVDTGGSRKDRIRKFQCSAYVEGRSCQHATRYDVPVWEPLTVDQIIERSAIVPRNQGNGQGKQASLVGAVGLEPTAR
jgi:Recombinase/Recombinase zinc beta ribbon domain